MIKKFKLFEQFEDEESWWEEESPFDNIKPENLVKSELIRNPLIHYLDWGLVKKITNESDSICIEIANSFNNDLTEYNMLYDEIDYKELKSGSIVLCNIPNIDGAINEYELTRVDFRMDAGRQKYWRARIIRNDYEYSVLVYNIKSVIKY